MVKFRKRMVQVGNSKMVTIPKELANNMQSDYPYEFSFDLNEHLIKKNHKKKS